MLVVLRMIGNHSNVLFQFASYYAFSKKFGLSFVPLDIYKLALHYEPVRKQYGWFATNVLYRALSIFVRVVSKVGLLSPMEISSERISNHDLLQLQAGKFLVVWGWNFRNPRLLPEYRPALLELFYEDRFLKGTELLGRKGTLGLHVRRGDYKTYAGGKYYYSDEVYVSWIHKLCLCLGDSVDKIIVFTNDRTIERAKYDKLPVGVAFSENDDFRCDQALMMKCSYLSGPPSTFSQWASFLGQVPLYIIESQDSTPEIGDFKVCDSPR